MTHTPSGTPTPADLRDQIEHTRHKLGVHDLADETDSRVRARHKARELKDQALLRGGAVKAQAAVAASQLQNKLPSPVKDKATHAAGRARAVTAQAGRMWEEKAPEPVQQKTALYVKRAHEHRSALAVAATGITMVWLVARSRNS
ncbi:DUF3618 domain-containing protein [Streptomyces sp. NPDC055056]